MEEMKDHTASSPDGEPYTLEVKADEAVSILSKHMVRMNKLTDQRIMNLWYMVLGLWVTVMYLLLTRF